MSDKSNQIDKIKELIGSDSNIAEEIIKYCQKIKNKSKSLIMKSYVLEKIDKTYDINIIEQYLDKIAELKHKVRDNTKDCYHDIKIHTSLKINEVLVDFKCEMNDDHEDNFIIKIDGKREGIYKSYHKNGQLSCEVNYIDGKRNGIFKSYHRDGELWGEVNYIDGKKS
jgi:antitoxin component YwqK of YwqJK toxin-antitoxin module